MWQTFLGAFLIVIAISIDLFICAFAYGTSKQYIHYHKIFLLNIIGTLIIGLGLTVGALLGEIIPASITYWLSFGLLLVLGFIKLIDSTRTKTIFKELSWRQTVILALALSIDGFAVGVCTAAHEFNITLCASIVVLSFITGIFIFWAGHRLGSKIAQKTSLNLGWLSGLILIILAFCKLFI